MKLFIFVLTFLIHLEIFCTVRILTFHYNQADFIEMQYLTLKKFLLDDFELIVFNDAKTEENEKWVENVCRQYDIKCVRFMPEWHFTDPLNTYLKMRLQEPLTKGCWGWTASTPIEEFANHPSVRHSHVIQYALDHFGYDHDDIVVIMDGDNFLIQPLSIRELLNSHDIVGFNQLPDMLGNLRRQGEKQVPKNREMFWVVFVAFNPRKIPNPHELRFNVDVVNGHYHLTDHTISDTGAAAHRYLQKYPHLRLQAYPWQDSGIFRSYFSREELKSIGFSDRLIDFINDIFPENVQFFAFEHFIHFSAVSSESTGRERKVRYLRQFIDDILRP